MNCMKCGREIPAEQVFCEECRAEMEKYPVKPGTVVQLPRRREEASAKKAARRRNVPTQEEQIQDMRRVIRSLLVLVLVQMVLIVCLAYPVVRNYLDSQKPLPGQNYSTHTDTPDSGETDE